MDRAKPLPSSLDAERTVLGACMTFPDAALEAASLHRREDFFLPEHQVIFGAILKLTAEGVPVDLKSRLLLRRFPNLAVRMSHELLLMHGMNVVTELLQHSRKPERKVLVQLNLHRMCGTSGTGKSSSAEAAANAMAD